MADWQPTPDWNDNLHCLQEAFDFESNACAKYTAYVARADRDGLFGVARLLRACYCSQQIRTGNLAGVIRKLDGLPRTKIPAVEVKFTLENLTASLDDEIFRMDFMSPHFLVRYRSIIHMAVQILAWALKAGKIHVRLISDVIREIEGRRAGSDQSVPWSSMSVQYADMFQRHVSRNAAGSAVAFAGVSKLSKRF